MSASLHGDVASAIGQQVEQMILQAKKDSEGRVRHDLTMARTQLQGMETIIVELGERVARAARQNGGPGGGAPDFAQTVDRAFLSQKITQLETKWGSEVKALKQDLHRTILAHNHNSDLMRHHRDALDEARRTLDAQTQPKPEQIDAQIEKVDKMLRAGQAKQRALDALTERLTSLEVQVGEMVPGLGGFPGMGGAGGAMGLPGAGFGGVQREQAAPKKRAGKEGEPPTQEEVRERLLQAARGGAIDHNFNAEAPVFVPNAEAPVFVPRGATAEAADSASSESATETPAAAAKGVAAAQAEAPTKAAEEEAAVDAEEEADVEPADA